MSAANVTVADRTSRLSRLRVPAFTPVLIAVVVVIVVGLAVRDNGFWVLIASTAVVSYVLIGSYNVIFGAAGLFSLAHASMYAVGAYGSVILETTYGWSFVPAALASMLAAVVIGVLLALPTARLEGAFLALGTLAFATAASSVIVNWTEVTGGTQGFLGIIPPNIFGRDLIGGTIEYYWFAASVAVVCFVFFRRLSVSAVGRRFVALRESEVSAQASGIDPIRTRVLAFVLSSFFAALAGVLYAHLALFISPETFALHAIIQILIITLIGGAGYLYGPVVAVIAEVAINQVVQRSGDGGQLIFGLAVILVIAFAPSGIMGMVERLWRHLQRRRGVRARRATAEIEAAVPDDRTSSVDPLVVRGIELSFAGVVAVSDVDFEIEPGEVVGMIGPNGAGKTSVVNVITGAVRPQAGSVRVGDTELLGRKPHDVARRGVTRTFQTTHLVPTFDLLTNVVLGRDLYGDASLSEDLLGLPRSGRDLRTSRKSALELLALVGVAEHAEVLASEVPYGVMRRAEIAKAMALDPAFLLLDEPGAGLSSYERDEVRDAIHAVAEMGVGCLLIDHNVSFVAESCQRLLVLAAGRVLVQGETQEVLDHPDVVTTYLGRTAMT